MFCAVDMKKEEIRALEERYAKAEAPVISNNSANRHTPDVPMLIPEINGAHAAVIEAQRRRLVEAMKHFALPLAGPRPIREAIVTAGGVKTGEVDPGTMMSKKTAGLFFAGEILDLDAYTGGFNLQIAWCTGRAAGEGAARYSKEERE